MPWVPPAHSHAARNLRQASKFVRDYQDVVSDGNYWFTDDDMCLASQGGEFYPARDLVHGTLPPGVFTDRFSGADAVHIYRVDGGSSCGAY